MRVIAVLILVVSMLISGCVGVNGEPLVIPDGNQIYYNGFIDGCMSGILALTTPQNLPPFEEALEACNTIYDMSRDGLFGEMPSQMSGPVLEQEPAVVCEGNCI
jgi:hypothetical protein